MCPFWNVPFSECALFGKCPFWNVPILECALFGMLFLESVLFGMCPFWNVPFLERAIIGMCSFWNVLLLECAIFGMYSFWNVPFSECALFGMFSFWNVPIVKRELAFSKAAHFLEVWLLSSCTLGQSCPRTGGRFSKQVRTRNKSKVVQKTKFSLKLKKTRQTLLFQFEWTVTIYRKVASTNMRY